MMPPNPAGFRANPRKSRTQTMTKTARTSTTTTRPKQQKTMTSEQMAIEDNYIKNLQQQVQFLEMELQLQQKVNVEHQQSLYAGAAPLDDTVNTLKMTFIQRDKEYKDRIRALEEENNHLKTNLESSAAHIDSLQASFDAETEKREREVNDQKNKLRAEIISNEKHIEGLERDIESSRKEIDRLTKTNDELAASNAEHEHREADRKEEMKRAKTEAEDAKDKLDNYKQETERTLNRAKDQVNAFQAADDEIRQLKKTIADYKNDMQALELTLKRTQFEKSQAEAANERSQKMLEAEAARYLELQTNHRETEKTLNETTQQLDDLKKTFSKSENALMVMEEEQRSRHAKYREYEKRISLLQNALDEQHSKNQNLESSVRSLESELAQAQETFNSHTQYYENMDKSNTEIRLENRNLKDTLMELESLSDVREQQTRELKREMVDLRTTNERMLKQLQLADLLKSLKETDFSSLLKTNMTISSQIRDLMTFLPAMDETE